MMLNAGNEAPDFELPSTTGKNFSSKDFLGEWTVLYFYPKDMTPGCTTESCDFRDYHGKFNKLGTQIVGVSPDSVASHEKFIGKHELPFQLLADESKDMLQAYGVWQEKSMYGKKYMGVARTTMIIDPEGRVAKVWEKVKVKEHVQDVLTSLEPLIKYGNIAM